MATQVFWPFEVDQHITAQSRYYAGGIGSAFFVALRDGKKILGTRCSKCGRVYAPPRQTCGPCFFNMSEADMVEIGPEGTVETFTVVNYDEPVMPRKAPFIYAVIRLDGADTGLAHIIDEADPASVTIGMRVKPVFEENRKGNILDIRHFRPV
jgi:uncharacterized OB-fold protein